MKVAIVGSRGFTDYNLLCEVMPGLDVSVSQIISGGARGADSLAEKYATDNDIPVLVFPADWDLGKNAGFVRNQLIVDACDVLVAFWDGKSKGTLDSISKGRRKNKNVIVINYTKTLSLL